MIISAMVSLAGTFVALIISLPLHIIAIIHDKLAARKRGVKYSLIDGHETPIVKD